MAATMEQAERRMVLVRVPSQSRVGVFYEIRKGADDRIYCACKAWRFSSDRSCKHLRSFWAALRAINPNYPAAA